MRTKRLLFVIILAGIISVPSGCIHNVFGSHEYEFLTDAALERMDSVIVLEERLQEPDPKLYPLRVCVTSDDTVRYELLGRLFTDTPPGGYQQAIGTFSDLIVLLDSTRFFSTLQAELSHGPFDIDPDNVQILTAKLGSKRKQVVLTRTSITSSASFTGLRRFWNVAGRLRNLIPVEWPVYSRNDNDGAETEEVRRQTK
jgi:hypothetical protein